MSWAACGVHRALVDTERAGTPINQGATPHEWPVAPKLQHSREHLQFWRDMRATRNAWASCGVDRALVDTERAGTPINQGATPHERSAGLKPLFR